MKKNIVMTILLSVSIFLFAISGIYNIRIILDNKSVIESYAAQKELLQKSVDNYTESLKAISDTSSAFSTNTELINGMLGKPLELVSITAQKLNVLGNLETVLTVDTVDDVAYFTNTIDFMTVTMKYSDFVKAYKHICSLPVIYRYINFDVEQSIATLTVRTIPIGDSPIGSESTSSVSPDIEQSQDQKYEEGEITYVGGEDE